MPRHPLNPEGRALWPLVWRDSRWPLYIMLAHATLGLVFDALGLLPVRYGMRWNGPAFLTMLTACALLLPILLALSLIRHRSLRAVQRRYLTVRAFLGALVVCVFVAQEAQMHDAFKRLLGRDMPFRWDATLSQASIWLHGGQPAWRWLDPVFHFPAMTAALDSLYIGWFPLVFLMGCVVAWLPRRGLRTRALCAWGLVWFGLGTVLAQLFSSAGPAYYHHVVSGPNPYAPLMAHLDSVNTVLPLAALQTQAAIWANIHQQPELLWLHVSAFPSMHVALPMFFAVAFWRVSRPLSLFLFAYTAVTLCGSIYLGWHYALDGYAAILGVLVLWRLAASLVRLRATRGHRIVQHAPASSPIRPAAHGLDR